MYNSPVSHSGLKMDEFSHSADYKRIFNFHGTIPDRIVAREGSQLEFKESFNWLAKEQYAKSMAAFANNRGGYVVFGVSNRPRKLVGLRGENFDEKDESVIAEYLNSTFSPYLNNFEK